MCKFVNKPSLGQLRIEESEYARKESSVYSSYLMVLTGAQINQQGTNLLLMLHEFVVSQFAEVGQNVVEHNRGRAFQSPV
jgi:hypothetical protein